MAGTVPSKRNLPPTKWRPRKSSRRIRTRVVDVCRWRSAKLLIICFDFLGPRERSRWLQDSQFLVWKLEVYRLSIVAGVIDPNGNVLIPGVCQGIMDRHTTECVLLGMPHGLYAFSVQEISLVPETSSQMSELSNPTWIPRRRAQAPRAVTLSQPTLNGPRVDWVNMPLEDCPYQNTLVEVSTGNGVWFMPWLSGCDWISDPTASSCTITRGLQSNTAYEARVSIQCDECIGVPSSMKVECGDYDSDPNICLDWMMDSGCFVKVDAFRAGSCPSTPSNQLFTASSSSHQSPGDRTDGQRSAGDVGMGTRSRLSERSLAAVGLCLPELSVGGQVADGDRLGNTRRLSILGKCHHLHSPFPAVQHGLRRPDPCLLCSCGG